MGKKRKKIEKPDDKKDSNTEFSNDYTSMDVASYTEMTGAAMRPPLTDAEAENYRDIISMPQQRADQANQSARSKRKEYL